MNKIRKIQQNGYTINLWEKDGKRRAYVEKENSLTGRSKGIGYIDLNTGKTTVYGGDPTTGMGLTHTLHMYVGLSVDEIMQQFNG